MKKIVLIFAVILLAAAVVYKFLPVICKQDPLADDIRAYAQEHSQMTLGEATDFDWDVAYIDMGGKMSPRWVVENYNLDIEPKARPKIKFLKAGCRILFLKDGELVEDMVFSLDNLMFMVTPDVFEERVIYPDTVFNAVDYYSEKYHKNNIALFPTDWQITPSAENETY